ncbi:tetratricopeptide repeat protein [Muricauda sp. 334s03]|uniref:Tetratricopeptide repeat protein n=1 Tax=Flagellimonas yonaguniensis TaxID=3031325 RepID=A0ABT5XZA6_9FLAO|nr:tetratricopeptide repeat protein [[Muricauda] yonaguniensis]MDF0716516.1 tetratricopeptide repeat protein [[Muricauda] yonaguniensis]
MQDKQRSLEFTNKSLEKSREIDFVKGEIEALYNLGLTHGMTGNYAESLEYLNACLSLATKNREYQKIKQTYGILGIVYKQIGDYPTSKEYYLMSLKLVDSLQLDLPTSSVYSNLGILYDLMGDQDKAIESYNKALEVYKGPDLERVEMKVLVNLAAIDRNNKAYKEALKKYLKVEVFYETNGNNMSRCINYSNIGNCYIKLNQWDLAQQYLLKALDLSEQASLNQITPVINYNLADLMLQQKKYGQAIHYSDKNLQALSAKGMYKLKFEAHDLASQIYDSINQLTKANYHLKQSMAYKDSLLNETKVKEIENLQVKYDVYTKDKEIKESELELSLLNTQMLSNRKRLVYLSIIAVLLLLSASLLYFRFLAKKKSNALLREKNKLISQQNEVIEGMNVQLEKQMLRAQMNPHFIFNSLSSIQHLINSNDRKGALTYLSKFSKLLRQTLESSINIVLPLKEEIELLKIYIELEALRFDNSFSYHFDVDKNLDIHNYEIPLLLVQPYIENAIIHGLMPKNGKKELKVSFRDTTENIVCTIEDNGVGLESNDAEKMYKRPSRGMSITAKRINALSKFSNQELVKVESCEKGTQVTILIPKN